MRFCRFGEWPAGCKLAYGLLMAVYISGYLYIIAFICIYIYIHLPMQLLQSYIVPADDMGVVEHTQKNDNSHVICKVKKTEKCISPMSSVKCLAKKKTHDTGLLQLFGLQKMQNVSCQLN